MQITMTPKQDEYIFHALDQGLVHIPVDRIHTNSINPTFTNNHKDSIK